MGPAWAVPKVTSILLKIKNQEPSFSQIVDQAFKRENLSWNDYLEIKKKMKVAPWLPKLYLGYDRALKETTSISISDTISVSSSTVTVGPEDNDWDQSFNEGDAIKVRAVWDLDELLFHEQSLSLSEEKRDLAKARMDLSDYLFKVYAERRQLQSQYYLMRNSPKKILIGEKIGVLTEKLDLYTDGHFKQWWWRLE